MNATTKKRIDSIFYGAILILIGIAFGLSGGKAHAQEKMSGDDGFFSLGASSDTGGMSAGPATNFGQNKSIGFSLRAGAQVLTPGLYAYGQFDMKSGNLIAAGRDIGQYDKNIFEFGLLYMFNEGGAIQPFVNAGICYTSYEGSFAAGTMKFGKEGRGCAVVGGGIRANFAAMGAGNPVIDFADISVEARSNYQTPLNLSVGGAPVTNLNFNNGSIGIRAGKRF
jgi:hypothetical protein